MKSAFDEQAAPGRTTAQAPLKLAKKHCRAAVNRALSKLGDMRISSLDDEVKAAAVAASMFEIVRDSEISAHSWNFAKARVRLPAEAEKPAFGWARQYLLPADCLRVLEAGPWPAPVFEGLIGGDTRSFVLEGGRILTNEGPTLNLLYLKRVTEADLFPAAFVEALAARLAVEMAESLTGSNSKRELAWKEYEKALQQARRLNAIGLPPLALQDDSWLIAHQRGVL